MKVSSYNIFVSLIFFTAPMGKLLSPIPALGSIRAFYFLLPMGVLYCLAKTYQKNHPQLLFLVILYIANCLFFIAINISLYPSEMSLNAHPIARFIVHALLASFFILAAELSLTKPNHEKWSLIRYSFNGFYIVTILGYIIFTLTKQGVIPASIYSSMNILTQEGYGLLRFSPGSYPNEFGVMSSFFSSAALYLLIMKSPYFSKKYLISFIFICFLGMVLATTRAAYLAFAVSFIYILLRTSPIKSLKFLPLLLLALFLYYNFGISDEARARVISISNTAYMTALEGSGSIGQRYEAWEAGLDLFWQNTIFGVGFENPYIAMLHNTYLQTIINFGLFGSAVIIAILTAIGYHFRRSFLSSSTSVVDKNYNSVAIIGLIHVLSFAISNHNQNHFLTWFAIYLFLSCGCCCGKQKNSPDHIYGLAAVKNR